MRSTGLGHSAAMLVTSNWGEIVETLPRPGRLWKWSECEMDKSLQWRLRRADLIEKDPDTGMFRTTETLWAYVIDRAGTDNGTPGVDLGQESLFAPGAEPRAPICRHTDSDVSESQGEETAEQVTLTGERAPGIKNEDDDDKWQMNELGSRSDEVPAGTGEVDVDLSQSRLTAFAAAERVGRLIRPGGTAYADA